MTEGQNTPDSPLTDDRDRELEELWEREARYRAIFEAAGDAVVVTDAHAIIVEVNPAACAAYGYSRKELVGLDARTLIHPDYHDAIDEAVAGLSGLGDGQRSVSLRTVALRKDGTTFISEGYATWLAHRGGRYLLTVGRDVTDRVTAEERLQEKDEMLERRVEERTQELRTLLDVSQSVGSTLELQPLLTR